MNKLTKCKNCGAEISKTANTCLQCGMSNVKPFYKKWWIWAIAVAVVISVAIGGGKSNTTAPSADTETPTISETKNNESVYSVGEVMTSDKFEITIKGVQTKASVGGKYVSKQAADGGIFVCVDFEYKNISKEPVSSFSCPEIKLKNSDGVTFNSDITASSYYATETDPNRKVLSDLNPGISATDSKVFEISKSDYENGSFDVIVNADKKFTVKIK